MLLIWGASLMLRPFAGGEEEDEFVDAITGDIFDAVLNEFDFVGGVWQEGLFGGEVEDLVGCPGDVTFYGRAAANGAYLNGIVVEGAFV